jgi:Ca2+-binding RTX toxin-like protein
MDGGDGNDKFFGGPGNDVFIGGKGSDFMFGAGSADTFVLHAADLVSGDADIVYFFTAAEGDSRLGYELVRALRDVADAARSLKTLADYLERHPDALIRGKGGPENK